jgi:sugar-specific transcriptional regulator TrmB
MQAVEAERTRKEQLSAQQALSDMDPVLLKFTKPVLSTEPQVEHENQVNALRDINIALTRFRLSKNEVKVYLYLARYGAQKAQKIAESLGVHRTEAYKILRTLENKGVIYRVLERPMKFTAVPFEKVLDTELEERRQRIHHLEKKKEELLHLWNALPKASETETEKETLQVLEGRKQISARISEILKASTNKLNAVVTDRHLIYIYNSSFFEELEDISKRRDIDVRILTEYSTTSTFVLEEVDLSNCDFAFLHIKDQPSFIVSDAGYMLLLMENEDGKFYAMETNYTSILKSYGNLFDLLWKSQDRREHS